MKRILKAKDVEKLENTSMASALALPNAQDLHLTSAQGVDVCGCSQCSGCSAGTVCTVGGVCCTGCTACSGVTCVCTGCSQCSVCSSCSGVTRAGF